MQNRWTRGLLLSVTIASPFAMSGCGSVVGVPEDETGTAGTDSGAGSTSRAETESDADGPATAATTTSGVPTTSASGPVSTTVEDTDDEASSGSETGTTGGPELVCPEDAWPNDGSELIEAVAVAPVAAWDFTGDGASFYTYLSDESAIPGEQSRGLRSDTADSAGAGVVLDTMSAKPFLGKRVRMRSWVARSQVENRANTWLRVDGPGIQILDNGSDRPGFGTSSDWELEDVVLDVPLEATQLVFGALLLGPGTILVNDPSFDVISDEVPTTQPNLRRPVDASLCLDEPGAFALELVHVVRSDTWTPLEGDVVGELTRDEGVTFNAIPSAYFGGDVDGYFGSYLSWAGQRAGQRLRLTVPVRAEGFRGEARLAFQTESDGDVVVHRSEPLTLGRDWSEASVVTELPQAVPSGSTLGLEVVGSGALWVGYGVVERVSDDVPVSPPGE